MSSAPQAGSENLIETHRSYAHALAAETARHLPPHIDRREIQAASELGLVEAAAAFDSSRGVLFKTFAYYRIRGAVYDCLHTTTWLSRSRYQAYRFERAASDYMQGHPSDSLRPGTPGEESPERKKSGTFVNCYLLSLDAMNLDLPEDTGRSPEQQALSTEDKTRIRAALGELPEKNRQVLEGYYFQDLSLEEVGARLGLSKSWASRLHAKSLEMVRRILDEKAIPKRAQARRSERALRFSSHRTTSTERQATI